tara:strand:- start:2357 stop:3619 length:1263 start_codon:yes stop_codon:yes gene_type:complete
MTEINNLTKNLSKTSLHSWHTANGGKMVDFGGWNMPVQYEQGILKEHLGTRRYGGLFDVSHMGRFRIQGKDTITFLQHVLSNDVESLKPWQAQYTLIPNNNGGLIDDAYLFRTGDEYFLVVNASNRKRDWNHLHEQAISYDVSLEDLTKDIAMVAFQGPLTEGILARLLEGGSMPENSRNRLSEIMLLGTKIIAARTGYTGEPLGFELFIPTEKVEEVWNCIYEAGYDKGIVAVGLGARDTLRLEAVMPLYGHEFGIDKEGKDIPAFSFPLTSVAVKFSPRKGDFVGHQALKNQFEEFHKLNSGQYQSSEILPRRILPLALIGKGIARHGDPVLLNGSKVGFVTSGTMVPYWKFEGEGVKMKITDDHDRRAIAMAYIDAKIPNGQELEVEVRGRQINSQLVSRHGVQKTPPYFRAIPLNS